MNSNLNPTLKALFGHLSCKQNTSYIVISIYYVLSVSEAVIHPLTARAINLFSNSSSSSSSSCSIESLSLASRVAKPKTSGGRVQYVTLRVTVSPV